MIPSSFRTREVRFAYLIGPPQMLSRREAMEIHDGVCQALGVDDFSFQYQTTPSDAERAEGARGESRGFGIKFEREQGGGTFKIQIENANIQKPVRLLCQYTWPPSREHVFQDIDLATEAVFDTLGEDWERVLAETRVRGQVEAGGGSGTDYLIEEVLGLEESDIASLDAPPSFATIGYETPPGDPTPGDQLSSPKREVTVEVLREDERSLYIEVMSQWPQLAPTSNGKIQIDAQRLRQFNTQPSEYLQDTVDYISEVLIPMLSR